MSSQEYDPELDIANNEFNPLKAMSGTFQHIYKEMDETPQTDHKRLNELDNEFNNSCKNLEKLMNFAFNRMLQQKQ